MAAYTKEQAAKGIRPQVGDTQFTAGGVEKFFSKYGGWEARDPTPTPSTPKAALPSVAAPQKKTATPRPTSKPEQVKEVSVAPTPAPSPSLGGGSVVATPPVEGLAAAAPPAPMGGVEQPQVGGEISIPGVGMQI